MAKSKSKSSKSRSLRKSKSGSPNNKYMGYCLRCKKMVIISGAKMSKTSKGQPMVKGKCPKCSTKVNAFVKR